MAEAAASTGLDGVRVCMLVWNGFVHDARVKREAGTLFEAGAAVRVIAVLTAARPVAAESSEEGIRITRVRRENPWLTRLVMLPRWLFRRVARTRPTTAAGAPRWWELDRQLALQLEELAVNVRMFRAALRDRPDVIHAHDVNTLVPAWVAARCCGARLVYDAHEISADREGYLGRVWMVRLAERWLGRAAHGTITTTQARADWFRGAYGYRDMVVLQNRPQYRAVTSRRIRDTLAIAPERVVVLYQGGLQWGRGLSNLLEAVRGLPDAELVFVGDGAQRASLEAASADLRERVHFVGQVPLDELPLWTASADIGVQVLRNTCLNHYTTDSNKLFEYVMGGLPVVASDFPEIRAVVDQYDLGLLVDPHSVAEIRAALQRLIDDPSLRQRYADNALRARDELDWGSQAEALLALYRRVVADG